MIGLGLGGLGYLTREAERRLLGADEVLLDTYTGWVSEELRNWLEGRLGPRLKKATRSELEEGAKKLVERALEKEVAVAVPGDPLVATTHITLILEAAKREAPYTVTFGVSAYSSAASASGLQAYKFGRTVTLAREDLASSARSCYRVIGENAERGLHTLVLLDTAGGGLRIPEALQALMEVEEAEGRGLVEEKSLAVALTRLGMKGQKIKAGRVRELISADYPPPPHMLIFPGELHFAEAEALSTLHGADPGLIRTHRPARSEKERVRRYIGKLGEVVGELEVIEGGRDVEQVLEMVESYLEDARIFWERGENFNALAAIAYAEGLLDALRLTGKVRFTWPR